MHLVSAGAENAGEGLRGRFTRQAHDVGVGSAGGDSGTCVRGILCSSARTRSVKTGSSERFACSTRSGRIEADNLAHLLSRALERHAAVLRYLIKIQQVLRSSLTRQYSTASNASLSWIFRAFIRFAASSGSLGIGLVGSA
jgi:hypothetical protein